MPIIETRGSLSSQGYGQFAQSAAPAPAAAYIENVFSTWLYTGNSSTQTITNGIDLATKGGLVWNKFRNSADWGHVLTDTNRGASSQLISNSTAAQTTEANRITSFNAAGFSIGSSGFVNQNNGSYVSWTFAKQPKFFDVVTYTGNGVAGRTVAHNLGAVPGCMIVKKTNSSGTNWAVYHRSLGNSGFLTLNTTNASGTASWWNNTDPTATTFQVGDSGIVNANGDTYVAYLFAHDAGGFGASGTDNVISCGSYTGNGSASGPIVTLGWEPQWILLKAADSSGNWVIVDNMRGLVASTNQNNAGTAYLYAESNSSEFISTSSVGIASITPTGFQLNGGTVINYAGQNHIYIAIRRGPMRTPTLGTNVFMPTVYTGTNVNNRLVNTSIAPDMVWMRQRDDAVLGGMVVGDRLRGQPYLLTGSSASEVTSATAFDQQLVSAVEYGNAFSSMNGVWVGTDATAKLNVNTTANNHIAEAFRRAPGFFDVVCYTGTGVNRTVNHNLGVVPEFILVKRRNSTEFWICQLSSLGPSKYLLLNATSGEQTDTTYWNNTSPTASVFSVGPDTVNNGSGSNYVAYLFASCPGVSKVGTYTGTGSTVQVNCGFTGGARFVLIKRTNAAGSWYVWDSARGIIVANDPYLVLNTTAAEVTSTDWVNTLATGFEVSNAGSNLVNVNGGTYIFLAIA